MTRSQFILLNTMGGLLAALVLGDVSLSLWNQRIGQRVAIHQIEVNKGRQAEVVLRRLALRVAQATEQDPSLTKILIRHDLKATFMIDGKKKEVP